MRTALDKLYDFCGYIAAAFMVGIAVSVIAQIVWRLRGLTFDSTEVAGLCLAASTFFGLAHTFRRGGHVRINLIIDRLPEHTRHRVEIALCVLGAGIVAFLAWNMSKLAIQSYQFGDKTPGLLAMSFWIPQMGVAAGLWMFAIALLDEVAWLLQGGTPRYQAPDEVEFDHPVA